MTSRLVTKIVVIILKYEVVGVEDSGVDYRQRKLTTVGDPNSINWGSKQHQLGQIGA